MDKDIRLLLNYFGVLPAAMEILVPEIDLKLE